MKKNICITLLAAFTLILASMACTISAGGPEFPKTPIAISTEAIASFDEQIQAAQTAALETGLINISVNETQITSLLAARLEKQTDLPIRDPQVTLRDGQIQIYGIVSKGDLEANVRVALSVTIDQDGKPLFTITSTDFGPIPAPVGLNNTISAYIGELFSDSLGQTASGMRLETINIADGVMTITGRVR